MKIKDRQLQKIAKIAIPILKKNGVVKAGIFGSYARGEARKQSDVDILIEPPDGMGITIVHLKRDLEDSLHKKVDLVSYKGISKYLKKYILASQIDLL